MSYTIDKFILYDGGPAPLTIHKESGAIVLKRHLNKMILHSKSSEWLLSALKSIGSAKQTIVHKSVPIIEVYVDSGYHYIIGQKARFVFKEEVCKKLIQWLEENPI